MKRPWFVSKGQWEWHSFSGTAGEIARTVIRLRTSPCGFQHLVEFDWADYGGTEEEGRKDAEALASYICDAVNRANGEG